MPNEFKTEFLAGMINRWLGDKITAIFVITLVVIAFLYTAFSLSPSSYGITLQLIHAPNPGLVAGHPKSIRSDEWGVWTPFFQATVRNHFHRFNATSLYNEDLRNVNALPLKDWGLIFKPQLWAFFVLSPARALSLYYAALICSFLAG